MYCAPTLPPLNYNLFLVYGNSSIVIVVWNLDKVKPFCHMLFTSKPRKHYTKLSCLQKHVPYSSKTDGFIYHNYHNFVSLFLYLYGSLVRNKAILTSKSLTFKAYSLFAKTKGKYQGDLTNPQEK